MMQRPERRPDGIRGLPDSGAVSAIASIYSPTTSEVPARPSTRVYPEKTFLTG